MWAAVSAAAGLLCNLVVDRAGRGKAHVRTLQPPIYTDLLPWLHAAPVLLNNDDDDDDTASSSSKKDKKQNGAGEKKPKKVADEQKKKLVLDVEVDVADTRERVLSALSNVHRENVDSICSTVLVFIFYFFFFYFLQNGFFT